MEFAPNEVEAFFANADPDEWSGLDDQLLYDGTPIQRLQGIVQLVEFARSQDDLCWIGVHFLEPLIDLYWATVVSDVEDALEASKDLRRAFSCCLLTVPKEIEVTHAGTSRSESGDLVTAGGRVLNVTALGDDADAARRAAYAAADMIGFDGKQLRRDIAAARSDRAGRERRSDQPDRRASVLG